MIGVVATDEIKLSIQDSKGRYRDQEEKKQQEEKKMTGDGLLVPYVDDYYSNVPCPSVSAVFVARRIEWFCRSLSKISSPRTRDETRQLNQTMTADKTKIPGP